MDDHEVPAEAMPSGEPAVTGADAGLSPWRPPTGGAAVRSLYEPSEFERPPFEPPPPPAPGPLWPGSSWGGGSGNGDQPWAPPPLVQATVAPPAVVPPVAAPTTARPSATPAQPGTGAVGRASAPSVAPLPGVPVQPAAASTYRSGELSSSARQPGAAEDEEPDPVEDLSGTQRTPPSVVPAPGANGELPRRPKGAALAAEAPGPLPTRRPRVPAESTWSAFAQPWLEEPAQPAQSAQPDQPAQGQPGQAGTLPGVQQPGFGGIGVQGFGDPMPTNRVPDPPQAAASAPVSARARVDTSAQPASAAEIAALRRTAEPRVYRSALVGGVHEPSPTPPPAPTPTPEPSPQPPEPGPTPVPSPAPAPQPPSPPGPPPPSPIPTPFPDPAPVPQRPPVPVPPEPPTPEPSPGPVPPAPPIPPVPPFPVPPGPTPVPPGPAPVPPFPGPPATPLESVEVPAASLPAWPPSTTPSSAHISYGRTPAAPAASTVSAAPTGPATSPAPLPRAGEHTPGQPDYVERLPWRAPAAPEVAAPGSDRYGDWARAGRPQGTVYGGQPLPSPAPASIENSGSLTGHILAQGHPVVPLPSTGRSKFMITVVVLVSLLVLVGVGYAVIVATHLLTH